MVIPSSTSKKSRVILLETWKLLLAQVLRVLNDQKKAPAAAGAITKSRPFLPELEVLKNRVLKGLGKSKSPNAFRPYRCCGNGISSEHFGFGIVVNVLNRGGIGCYLKCAIRG